MQALAHQRRGQAMREALDMQQTSSWREFQAVTSVLIAAGALQPDTYRVSLHCTVSPAVRQCQLVAVTAAAMPSRDTSLVPHACCHGVAGRQLHAIDLNAMRPLLLMGCRLQLWARWRARSVVRTSSGWPSPSPMQLCR